ncbi:BON domain-containing protein [Anabaena subtropica]|uniref:BON domain-containing protein n=1 Tax=Anabaena subtropica FACHB-260 TaxID=2692884 RepID=A0ABR8CU04_9NOST|nr:BON domain-containing protein [Anabaena subtropica]MBD2346479.1 BON domain-containing protein [Anabaena subtropica FACHB-260]
MKKLFSLLVSGFLIAGSFGCQEAPSTTNSATQSPTKQTSESIKTTGKTIKSTVRETTIPLTGTNTKDKLEIKKTVATKTPGDLKTSVSKKLQAGIPGNKFLVENQQGEITLKGIATSQEELKKAENLIKEIEGVKSVKIEAKVEPARRS